MIRAFVTWLVDRLEEPSTYAGVSGLVVSLTFLPAADLAFAAKAVALAATVIPSALSIVLPEAAK